jgi:hypothetical protein
MVIGAERRNDPGPGRSISGWERSAQHPQLRTTNLRAETFAAGATGRGVGVFYFETAVGKGVDVIQFGAGDVESAFGIDHDSDAGAFDKDIAIGRAVLQIHFVLQPAAAAANHGHPQHAIGAILPLQKRAHLARGILSHFHQTLVADPKVRAGGGSGLRFCHHPSIV